MLRKQRRNNKKVTSSEIASDENKLTINLSEDSINIAYWVYSQDNEFYDRKENRSFLIKSMLWSLVITIAQLLLIIDIFDNWTHEMITLSNLFPTING